MLIFANDMVTFTLFNILCWENWNSSSGCLTKKVPQHAFNFITKPQRPLRPSYIGFYNFNFRFLSYVSLFSLSFSVSLPLHFVLLIHYSAIICVVSLRMFFLNLLHGHVNFIIFEMYTFILIIFVFYFHD